MLHLITILSFSTIISIVAYMIQHGEIESGKNFVKVAEQTIKMDDQNTMFTTSVNYLRSN